MNGHLIITGHGVCKRFEECKYVRASVLESDPSPSLRFNFSSWSCYL